MLVGTSNGLRDVSSITLASLAVTPNVLLWYKLAPADSRLVMGRNVSQVARQIGYHLQGGPQKTEFLIVFF